MSKRIYNINYHTSAPGERTIYARSFLNLQVRLISQDYDHQIGVALDFENSGATSIKFLSATRLSLLRGGQPE